MADQWHTGTVKCLVCCMDRPSVLEDIVVALICPQGGVPRHGKGQQYHVPCVGVSIRANPRHVWSNARSGCPPFWQNGPKHGNHGKVWQKCGSAQQRQQTCSM